ncbi:DUF2637 domain-containing protein [Micromonospora chokoriensis]
MNARRVASIVCTVVVCLVAAIGSYGHMKELALMAGQGPFLSALLPLSVDGMILVASLALNDGREKKGSAWLAFLVGVLASLAANVIVADPDIKSRAVSAWPAVALLLTVEVLARAGKKKALPIGNQQTTPLPIAAAVPIGTLPTPLPIPCRSESVKPVWWSVVPIGTQTLPIVPIAESAQVSVSPAPEPMPNADSAKVSKPRQRRHVVPAHPESAQKSSAEILAAYEAMRADGMKIGAIAEKLGISPKKLYLIRQSVPA